MSEPVVHVSELTKIFKVPERAGADSRLHWPTLLPAVAFGGALFAFTRWFWRFGLRRYSGASA